MADAFRSVAARGKARFAAYVESLLSASSSSSSAPTCNVEKIHEETKGLIRMLNRIRATLDDAEKRQISDDSITLRLRELEGLSFEAEDVLDEFAYEETRLGLIEGGGFDAIDSLMRMTEAEENLRTEGRTGEVDRQVKDSISSPAPSLEILAFLNDVGQRIKVIHSRFDELKEHTRALWLEGDYGARQVDHMMPVKQPSSSLIEGRCFIGRTEDLKAVKRFLFSDEVPMGNNSGIPVMAIVGMGGLGKTALAQHAYNDDEVDMHFPLKSWVCVSEGFDLVQLTKAMVESLIQKPSAMSTLDPLQRKLGKELAGKKILLVLDDIWDVKNLSSNWDQLTAPLCHGSAGCKIIITTRNEKVSKMLRGALPYHLRSLEDGACLKLFSQHAFEGRAPNSCQNLMDIARKISIRCKGLPLLAKSLGSLLRCKDDEQMWNEILESNNWDVGEENNVMDILALSYWHLPAHLKRCFRYCSVFPKDYQFDKDQLVQMWMAHGYIKAKGLRLIEDIGNEYFDDLLCRSFFQHSQNPYMFLMHDIIHDLARCVSRDECYNVEGDKHYAITEHVHHISIITKRNHMLVLPLEEISMSATVRSFMFVRTSFSWDCHINFGNDLFTRMKSLRLLDLRDTGLQKLPNSISCLKHLRYLGLRGNPIKELPKSIGRLFHLQTLDLQSCTSFKGFSVDILNLINLRHLIHDSNILAYPVGIGKLTNLQSMPGFFLSRNNNCAKLGELKDINSIRSLIIKYIDTLTEADEAKKACIEKKEHLRALDLSWDQYRRPSPIEDEVLESLKPCSKLELLKISYFYGTSLPSWLGHHSFFKLASVELIGCQCWTFLPPLGQLPSLKQLSISSAKQVEDIGNEFFSGGFPQLETLQLLDMDRWKSWCGARKGECPKLRELFISRCFSLSSLSIVNLHALESLIISDCHQLHFSSEDQLPSALHFLSIHGCRFLKQWCQRYRQRLVHIPNLLIQGLDEYVVLHNTFSMQEARDACLEVQKRLHTLELVWDCRDGERSFKDVGPEEVLENLRPHNNLNKLVIQGYTGSRFAAWVGDPSFSNLVYVTLFGCSQCQLLPPLGQLPHLKELCIVGAHLVQRIGSEFFNTSSNNSCKQAFPSLEKVEFDDMLKWEEWAETEDGYLPYLSELILKDCPMLKMLPHVPPSLRKLEVLNCNVITFPHSFEYLSTLRTLRFSQLPALQKLPNLPMGLLNLTVQGLPALVDLVTPPSLRHLVLEGCNGTMVAASLPELTHLSSLHISDFPELIRLPLHNLVILQNLHIRNCPELASFDCFTFHGAFDEYIEGLQALKSLESLLISDCPKLHFSANERPPSVLRSMDIKNCHLLAEWHDKHWRNRTNVDR